MKRETIRSISSTAAIRVGGGMRATVASACAAECAPTWTVFCDHDGNSGVGSTWPSLAC